MSVNEVAGKNCLLVFRNKKINQFENVERLIKQFAESGYSLDKVSLVAYDNSEEIVRAIVDGKENYENLLIYCPKSMERTLKKFIKSLYKAEFNEFGVLKANNLCVLFLFADTENKLLNEDIKKLLDNKYGIRYDRAFVKFVGAPHVKVESAIKQAKNLSHEVEYNISNVYGDCTIEIVYSDKTSKMVIDEIVRTIITELNDYIYAMENITLAERLFQLLKLRRMKIRVAESFTGGGISKRLVDIPGISEVYIEGLNTYSNSAKVERLGVSEYILSRYGAVSKETAVEMAEGLIKTDKCDISISTTGIAGPKSDNTAKPVGLVYIGIGTADSITAHKYNLKGGRKEITETAINLALFLAYKAIK